MREKLEAEAAAAENQRLIDEEIENKYTNLNTQALSLRDNLSSLQNDRNNIKECLQLLENNLSDSEDE